MFDIQVDTNSCKKFSLDFNEFSQLQEQPELLASLVGCYREVFSEPGVWEESYSEADVMDILKKGLEGCASLRVYVLDRSGEVVAFCWAQFLSNTAVADAIVAVQYVTDGETSLNRKKLLRSIGESPVIYLQDLGIKKMYRGSIPLEELIYPVLESVSVRANTRELFFWSVSETCVSWLAHKVGVKKVQEESDLCFFRGVLPNINAIRSLDQ